MGDAQLSSLDVLSEELRDQVAAQIRYVEGLDAKAGVLLGLAGVVVALAPPATTILADAGRLSGVISASCSLLALSPREHSLIDLRAFRAWYLTAPPASTRLALLDTRLVMLEEALFVGDQKSHRLRASIAALVLAIILVFVDFAAA